MKVLPAVEWRPLADAHTARVDAFVEPHLARRSEQVSHPVHDFLFTYYSHRPAQLRRWHPGFGVGLEDAPDHAALKGYEQVECARGTAGHGAAHSTRVAESYVSAQRPLLRQLHTLLTATAGRAPQLGCFGLREWAMVHRSAEHGTRHDYPLRLGQDGTDAVVESHRIGCSHFDAFRFFTPTARPLNTLQPTRDDRPVFEQPGCLHAGMDLYKHAFRLSPMVPSDLVADCFELARDIRVLDMRAAPYDLTDLGFEPVAIETTAGKAAYVEAQRGFAERGAPLRARLIEECERLLAAQNS
ncbi:3-methyladenine DNA glycosylase [Nocardioides zhouii]|uniref:3-methyladenine DNA glycosylase n=1 Tax=Nocardioides zhouii TaxID=1168729 RepID=A0A4Q2T7C0_9ACTN|nr:3-methyladenine DNA glycosylase [Nocardioides zhouii]RYC12924.1 3-methyladenine DNA glycosylase [Nocardioides zhouii]